jgi:hypothetical protein
LPSSSFCCWKCPPGSPSCATCCCWTEEAVCPPQALSPQSLTEAVRHRHPPEVAPPPPRAPGRPPWVAGCCWTRAVHRHHPPAVRRARSCNAAQLLAGRAAGRLGANQPLRGALPQPRSQPALHNACQAAAAAAAGGRPVSQCCCSAKPPGAHVRASWCLRQRRRCPGLGAPSHIAPGSALGRSASRRSTAACPPARLPSPFPSVHSPVLHF